MKKILIFIYIFVSISACTPEQRIHEEVSTESTTQTGEIHQSIEAQDTVNTGEKLIIKKIDARSVEILGPEKLLSKMKECEFRHFFGYGYTLDWGDGTTKKFQDDSCSTSHTYSVGGEFSIQASLWHPGPTDAPETDWKDSINVQIEKQKIVGTPQVEITQIKNPHEGDIYYYQEFPIIAWKTKNLDTAYTLYTEAVDKTGILVSNTAEQKIAFNNSGLTQLGGAESYDKQILQGVDTMFLRLRLVNEDGQEVFRTTSSGLKISGQYRPNATIDQTLQVTLEKNTVELKKSIYHPECYSYLIDWGDGTSPEQNSDFFAKDRCPLGSTTKIFSHTYEKNGAYTIIFKDNSYNPFHSAAENAGFVKRELVIE